MAVIGLVAAGLITSAGPTHAASKATYYLALGNSVAAGEQPIGGPSGAGSSLLDAGYNSGYPEQLLKELRTRPELEQLRLEKLACGGETTQTMFDGIDSGCPCAAGSQLGASP